MKREEGRGAEQNVMRKSCVWIEGGAEGEFIA